MKLRVTAIFSFLICILVLINPNSSYSAVRTSAGVVGGIGVPVGWWGDRWTPFVSSELNLHYHVSNGTGILLLVGLNKAQLTDLSSEEIASESHLSTISPEFAPYSRITSAEQGGSFKQIPLGLGLYMERMIGNSRALRGYGSVAMVVNLWKFDRSQSLYIESDAPDISHLDWDDNWVDQKDGSNVGAQGALGVMYEFRPNVLFETSVAFHMVNLGKQNGAIAYWGQPARTWDDEKLQDANGSANFIQLRFGIRYGS